MPVVKDSGQFTAECRPTKRSTLCHHRGRVRPTQWFRPSLTGLDLLCCANPAMNRGAVFSRPPAGKNGWFARFCASGKRRSLAGGRGRGQYWGGAAAPPYRMKPGFAAQLQANRVFNEASCRLVQKRRRVAAPPKCLPAANRRQHREDRTDGGKGQIGAAQQHRPTEASLHGSISQVLAIPTDEKTS